MRQVSLKLIKVLQKPTLTEFHLFTTLKLYPESQAQVNNEATLIINFFFF